METKKTPQAATTVDEYVHLLRNIDEEYRKLYWPKIAKLYLRSGDYAQSRHYITSYLQCHPADTQALLLAAEVGEKGNDYQLASECLETLIKQQQLREKRFPLLIKYSKNCLELRDNREMFQRGFEALTEVFERELKEVREIVRREVLDLFCGYLEVDNEVKLEDDLLEQLLEVSYLPTLHIVLSDKLWRREDKIDTFWKSVKEKIKVFDDVLEWNEYVLSKHPEDNLLALELSENILKKKLEDSRGTKTEMDVMFQEWHKRIDNPEINLKVKEEYLSKYYYYYSVFLLKFEKENLNWKKILNLLNLSLSGIRSGKCLKNCVVLQEIIQKNFSKEQQQPAKNSFNRPLLTDFDATTNFWNLKEFLFQYLFSDDLLFGNVLPRIFPTIPKLPLNPTVGVVTLKDLETFCREGLRSIKENLLSSSHDSILYFNFKLSEMDLKFWITCLVMYGRTDLVSLKKNYYKYSNNMLTKEEMTRMIVKELRKESSISDNVSTTVGILNIQDKLADDNNENNIQRNDKNSNRLLRQFGELEKLKNNYKSISSSSESTGNENEQTQKLQSLNAILSKLGDNPTEVKTPTTAELKGGNKRIDRMLDRLEELKIKRNMKQ